MVADLPIGTANESPLRIRLLGQFSVWLDGQPIPDERWRSRRASSLVKLLALAPGFRLHRDQVIEALWPETGLASAANSFHQALHLTRQALGPACLRLEEGLLALAGPAGQPPWVDAARFAAAANAARDPEACQAALDLYPGDLLPDDRYEEWTLLPRQALRQQYLDLLLSLARGLAERRDYPPAIAALTRLLVADPAGEEAHAALMRVYALSGQRQAALRQFQTLREALRAELDAEPGQPACQLYEAIRSGAFPPGDSLPVEPTSPRHNLPAQLTSFIGREDQLAQVAALVRDHRLVTVTGAGGVGKTRLALQVAGQLLDHFPHGVWLVELAPLADPNFLPNLLAQALNMIVLPGQDIAQVLEINLKPSRLLLVLDNCEHLIQAAAKMAGRLLTNCPDLRILATSREILGLPGEAAFYCPSLTLPMDDSLPALAQSEAACLFSERVRASQPAFRLDGATAAPVARICRRLDGIPLAIELAAALARALSIAQIATRLDDAFRLLTGGSRAALPRHQTLRACIDWSYNLLSPEERALLMRLAVFAGGWTLEAAEQVCADPPAADRVSIPGSPPGPPLGSPHLETGEILALLGRLVDKSLVQFDLSAPGEPRYHMLETIRQYALQRLVESGAEAALRERHLDAFLALARRAEPHLRARGAKDWLDRLERELDNLRAALDGSLHYSIAKGLELAGALHWLWGIRGYSIEGVERLKRLLAAHKDRQGDQELDLPEKVARGRALNTLACLIVMLRDYWIYREPPAALVQESQAIFAGLGEAYRLDYAWSRFNQAIDQKNVEMLLDCREQFGNLSEPFGIAQCNIYLIGNSELLEERTAYAEENLAIREEIGDLDGKGWAKYKLAEIAYSQGRLECAAALIREGQACFQEVGNIQQVAAGRPNLLHIALTGEDYQEVIRQAELLRGAVSAEKEPKFFLVSIFYPAIAAWAMGDYALAERRCADALADLLYWPEKFRAPFVYLLARVALSQADLPRALDTLKRFLRPGMYDPGSIAWAFFRQAIQALGIIAARHGQVRRAGVLFGAQEAAEGWDDQDLSPPEHAEFDQALASVRAALGEEAFSAAWEAGRAMTVEELIAFAREGMDDTSEPG